MTSQCGVGGSRETSPSLICAQNGHFRIDVIMQWSIILCCPLHLLSCSYRTIFHLLFLRFDCLKTSQNALNFGMKCSKLCRFLGRSPIPRWGPYDAPQTP